MDYGLYEITSQGWLVRQISQIWFGALYRKKNSPTQMNWRILLSIFLTINEKLRLTS